MAKVGPEQVEYVIRLKARPGPVPPVHRLRHLLKLALRCYDLVCTSAEEVPPTPPAIAGDPVPEPSPHHLKEPS